MNQQPLFYLKPVVTSVMDLTMLRFTRPGRRSRAVHEVRMVAYRFLFWYSLLKSKAIITISNFVKQDLVNNYPFIKKKPITVTYCASEPPLKAIASPPSGIQKPFIIHVGSPFPHKNIDRLVDAFGLLKQTQPDLKLVLVGKIEHYFEQLQIYINSTPHKDDIIVTGFVSDEALKWLYQNAEAYALPSLSEGFGLPGLEAMAHGCPVASSNATCLPEVYGDAVVYFDPENAQDMADKIGQVISNKTLGKELVQKGYEQLKKYSWERMANQTLEVYNKTLDS